MLQELFLIAALAWIGPTGINAPKGNDMVTSWWGYRGQVVQSTEYAGGSKQTAGTRRAKDTLTRRTDSLLELFGNNRELILYSAVAGFGILMMGLAIGNASSHSKSKTEAQIDLLRQEKEKAENLAKLKAEFLNQVSHELRTPLAVIIGYIECITDGLYGEIKDKHLEILQVVAKQSTHLKNMIDQILIYSRLEAGKQPVKIEELDLGNVLKELKDTFEFLCKQKGLTLHWETFRESIPILSDAVRLKEILSNLLQNAVKYTDEGFIALRATKSSQDDSLAIEVQDSGMGISETHLTGIFEPFMQVHKTSTENSRGGIGLGLSIVKKHLELINGTISVKSELGKGSTFRIVLPRHFSEQKSRRWFFRLAKSRPRPNHTADGRFPVGSQKVANPTHSVT